MLAGRYRAEPRWVRATMWCMGVERDNDELRSQLLRGVLELCLLAVLSAEPTYAYRIGQQLSTVGLPDVSEGTIYPLLARLERGGLLASARGESAIGPPRKYYELTSAGRRRLSAAICQWSQLAKVVDACLSWSVSA